MKNKYKIVGCTYCGTCPAVCPVNAIKITTDGAQIDYSICTGCGQCYDNCPYEAVILCESESDSKKG